MEIIKLSRELGEFIPKNYTGIVEWSNGDTNYYKKGELHRDDGPAVECWNGTKHWVKEGKSHRTDGPAIEFSDGTKEWYFEGKEHRIDGPAIEYADGTKKWCIEGKSFTEIVNTRDKIFLGKEKGKYGLEWYKFMTEKGIEEYPIIPGLEYKVIVLQPLEEFLKQK